MKKQAKIHVVLKGNLYLSNEKLVDIANESLADYIIGNMDELIDGAEWEITREYAE